MARLMILIAGYCSGLCYEGGNGMGIHYHCRHCGVRIGYA